MFPGCCWVGWLLVLLCCWKQDHLIWKKKKKSFPESEQVLFRIKRKHLEMWVRGTCWWNPVTLLGEPDHWSLHFSVFSPPVSDLLAGLIANFGQTHFSFLKLPHKVPAGRCSERGSQIIFIVCFDSSDLFNFLWSYIWKTSSIWYPCTVLSISILCDWC